MRALVHAAFLLALFAAVPSVAQETTCTPLRFEQIAQWEPFACVHIEGTTACPAANVRGYVSEETSGGRCSPERDALYTFTLPQEITSVSSAHYTRDLELLFLATTIARTNVAPETVIGIALKHGQPYRTLRGADFGVPPVGVTNAALSVSVNQNGAFSLALAQPTPGGFRASVVVESPTNEARVARGR
jgi:hypothetical protein